jgi:hypothetical protein
MSLFFLVIVLDYSAEFFNTKGIEQRKWTIPLVLILLVSHCQIIFPIDQVHLFCPIPDLFR